MDKNSVNFRGYSLPISPEGKSSLVSMPPWFFGGDTIEIAFKTDINVFKKFLPYPFELSDSPGLVAISIVDMTSVSDPDIAYNNPERAQYRECLVKLHCKLDGKQGWFVPASWVDKDFSLLRGFIQGFGKKLGQIHITKLHEMNPVIGGKRPGVKIKGICESFNAIHIELGLELERITEADCFANTTMYVVRHYPDIEDPSKPIIHEISELVARNANKVNIWEGKGEVVLWPSEFEEITLLQPKDIVSARVFSEGFELIGGRVLYRY